MNQNKVEKQIKAYAELAKKDKSIDVASLMLSALEVKDENLLPASQKRWAYVIALGLPPFGLIYAVKFWFSGKDDGQDAAWVCMVLTAVSILTFVILSQLLLSGTSTAQLEQIQQIKPRDIQQLYE